MPITRRSFVALTASTAAALTLAACSGSNDSASGASPAGTEAPAATTEASAVPTSVTIASNTGEVEVALPVERPACLDNRSFEILATWGVSLVAAPKRLIPSTVTAFDGEEVADIGNHREPKLEALVAAEPDVIISGQRFSQYNEDIAALTEGTPLIDLEPRDGEDFAAELVRHVTGLGEVFSKQDEAKALVDDFHKATEKAKTAYDGTSTVMAVNVSGGEIGYVAPHVGRTFGPVFDMLGLKPALEVAGATDDHQGDDISVEAIAESNPDWILVLDRDAAIKSAEEGYTPAEQVIAGNAALQNVTAVASGHIVYAPADTYTNESIITYTEIMDSIAAAFSGAKG
ncbi:MULTISPECIES: ABC transporter substrate-binding protein [unclassified Actinomyces]|uniref:siderophore ABC transporter substrate-binding protein n=1 Tax=unclassified Actinomyces TaxID=2609248 RepID=UPI0020170077|nr:MULTISPECIES: ABC transporter substrate-binding protein [unclassified Actinomyces]MCL3777183.1 ABC transporter substrate-binding protein [Actinomyces sp. AC-20-1]MCL3788993.1 ABC transporter substrate-binding protein [Actinomyces sp. 187325]MCL3791348.1 ABC transporter substrate-binding protein [Actinomyces sp. 186855]MCL3793941.1 ABC transporter substrate-binding protein [Actinomyces sp. 217892]